MKSYRKPWLRRAGIGLLLCFIFLNAIAALHAWRFTHFTNSRKLGSEHGENMPVNEKIMVALTGIPNPRPVNKSLPSLPYKHIMLQSNVKLACWYIPAAVNTQGTVIMFHGYGGEKSGMLPKATALHDLGYNVLLPDFMGAGASEGSQTTIGFKEAKNVKTCYDYIRHSGEKKIILLGTSMGAVAVLKYLDAGGREPSGIIIECPFGTMYQTVCARFKMVGGPAFPMAGLLVFWGGLENGFWAFSHNPAAYAKAVRCPALLFFGAKDDRVTLGETKAIFKNLAGPKKLVIFREAGHNNYFIQYQKQWVNDVASFTHSIP